jgi:hypothetical protein
MFIQLDSRQSVSGHEIKLLRLTAEEFIRRFPNTLSSIARNYVRKTALLSNLIDIIANDSGIVS